LGTIVTQDAPAQTLRYQKPREETTDKFPLTKAKEYLLTPKLRKSWNGKEEKGPEERKKMREVIELSRASAPGAETTVTHLVRTHSADRTPHSPVGLGFPEKYGKGQ